MGRFGFGFGFGCVRPNGKISRNNTQRGDKCGNCRVPHVLPCWPLCKLERNGMDLSEPIAFWPDWAIVSMSALSRAESPRRRQDICSRTGSRRQGISQITLRKGAAGLPGCTAGVAENCFILRYSPNKQTARNYRGCRTSSSQ